MPPAEEEAKVATIEEIFIDSGFAEDLLSQDPTGLLRKSRSEIRRDSGDLVVGGLE